MWRYREAILDRCRGRCWYCGAALTRGEWTLDHVQPRSRGGGSGDSNLVAACVTCNGAKGNRTLEEYRFAAGPDEGRFYGEVHQTGFADPLFVTSTPELERSGRPFRWGVLADALRCALGVDEPTSQE